MIAMEVQAAAAINLRTCQSPYVFNCRGQLIAKESIFAKISNSGEKADFSVAFRLQVLNRLIEAQIGVAK